MSCPPSIRLFSFESIKFAFIFSIFSISVLAQKLKVTEVNKPKEESYFWEYLIILGLGIALGGAIFWWLNRRKSEAQEIQKTFNPSSQNKPRRFKKKREFEKSSNKPLTSNESFGQNPQLKKTENIPTKTEEPESSLPIFEITEVGFTKPIIPLPLSNDESLISAIEQANEELEEDEDVRALALKILAMFRNRNSVEAISQIALYDISANLRAKAVTILAEFNHESVFETILLACADPSREVRAAAAKGLFHLDFDRTEAWLGLTESNDSGRIRQAARAAIAGNFVERSVERLTHPDKKYASEAFAILTLLIKGEETDEIFEFLYKTKAEKTKMAILHTLKVVKEAKTIEKLYSMWNEFDLPNEMRSKFAQNEESLKFGS